MAVLHQCHNGTQILLAHNDSGVRYCVSNSVPGRWKLIKYADGWCLCVFSFFHNGRSWHAQELQNDFFVDLLGKQKWHAAVKMIHVLSS